MRQQRPATAAAESVRTAAAAGVPADRPVLHRRWNGHAAAAASTGMHGCTARCPERRVVEERRVRVFNVQLRQLTDDCCRSPDVPVWPMDGRSAGPVHGRGAGRLPQAPGYRQRRVAATGGRWHHGYPPVRLRVQGIVAFRRNNCVQRGPMVYINGILH
jgi:hypothetical protein